MPSASGATLMYSSSRWTLPPVVSPTQSDGMPRLIGMLASVLEASNDASIPSDASVSAAIRDDGALLDVE